MVHTEGVINTLPWTDMLMGYSIDMEITSVHTVSATGTFSRLVMLTGNGIDMELTFFGQLTRTKLPLPRPSLPLMLTSMLMRLMAMMMTLMMMLMMMVKMVHIHIIAIHTTHHIHRMYIHLGFFVRTSPRGFLFLQSRLLQVRLHLPPPPLPVERVELRGSQG